MMVTLHPLFGRVSRSEAQQALVKAGHFTEQLNRTRSLLAAEISRSSEAYNVLSKYQLCIA